MSRLTEMTVPNFIADDLNPTLAGVVQTVEDSGLERSRIEFVIQACHQNPSKEIWAQEPCSGANIESEQRCKIKIFVNPAPIFFSGFMDELLKAQNDQIITASKFQARLWLLADACLNLRTPHGFTFVLCEYEAGQGRPVLGLSAQDYNKFTVHERRKIARLLHCKSAMNNSLFFVKALGYVLGLNSHALNDRLDTFPHLREVLLPDHPDLKKADREKCFFLEILFLPLTHKAQYYFCHPYVVLDHHSALLDNVQLD